MKISKLFHWLYAILMLLPFGLVIFNCLHGLFSPSASTLIDWNTFIGYLTEFFNDFDIFSNLSGEIYNVYDYLIGAVFGIGDAHSIVCIYLTYWTCISIIWLVFDVFMYVPLLVHRWLDKAKIE